MKKQTSHNTFPTNGLLTDVIRKLRDTDYCRSTIVVNFLLRLEDLRLYQEYEGAFKKPFRLTGRSGHYLIYIHFDLGINTVFSSVNQDYMDRLIDFVNGLEGIRITLYL
jgi:hypothetical protein